MWEGHRLYQPNALLRYPFFSRDLNIQKGAGKSGNLLRRCW